METGKTIEITYLDKQMTVCNQRCKGWTHPYNHETRPQATLSSAGCGVFSTCHAAQWLGGKTLDPERLAVFSMENGGRGDDGTDRPALLGAMQEKGLAAEFGFRYEFDGLRNDVDTLLAHLLDHCGAALCNLRPGHIVALVDARRMGDEVQVLAIDSYSETLEPRVMPVVREVVPESVINAIKRNEKGVYLGETTQFAMYWCAPDTIRDFNLLHAL